MREQRPRDIEEVAQSYRARKWRSKGLNPSLSTPVFSCIFHVHVFSLLNILPSRFVVVIGVIPVQWSIIQPRKRMEYLELDRDGGCTTL